MRITLKFAESLNFKRMRKVTVFTRFPVVRLAKRPKKSLVKTRPLSHNKFNMASQNAALATDFGYK